MRLSDYQVAKLATLENGHGRLIRVDDDSHLGRTLLEGHAIYSCAFFCANCGMFAIIDPEGQHTFWAFERLVGLQNHPTDAELR